MSRQSHDWFAVPEIHLLVPPVRPASGSLDGVLLQVLRKHERCLLCESTRRVFSQMNAEGRVPDEGWSRSPVANPIVAGSFLLPSLDCRQICKLDSVLN